MSASPWAFGQRTYAITRGAGSRDSRQLSDALDNLGVDRGESAGTLNVQLSGATLARNLLPTLELYADILRRPHLPEDELDAAKSLSLQDIQSTEDEPQRKVMIELRKRYYPDPLGRDNRGTEEGVTAVSIDDVRHQHARLYQPRDVILSVVKVVVFALLVIPIHCYYGYYASGGPEGVGRAAGRAIRTASVLIAVADMLMTFLFWGTAQTVGLSA